jgi:hypothetical protein
MFYIIQLMDKSISGVTALINSLGRWHSELELASYYTKSNLLISIKEKLITEQYEAFTDKEADQLLLLISARINDLKQLYNSKLINGSTWTKNPEINYTLIKNEVVELNTIRSKLKTYS